MKDDLIEGAGRYLRHRMPELSQAQARDAAMHALDWLSKHLEAQRHNAELDELEALFGAQTNDHHG